MITKKYSLLKGEQMKLRKQISRARGCNPGYKTKHVTPHAGAACEERGQGTTPEQEMCENMGIASLALTDPDPGKTFALLSWCMPSITGDDPRSILIIPDGLQRCKPKGEEGLETRKEPEAQADDLLPP